MTDDGRQVIKRFHVPLKFQYNWTRLYEEKLMRRKLEHRNQSYIYKLG